MEFSASSAIAVAGADPLPLQEGGDAAGQLPELAVADGTAVIGGYDVGLVGMAFRRAVDPFPEKAGTGSQTLCECNTVASPVSPAGPYRSGAGERQAWKLPAAADRIAGFFLDQRRR